jgi:hypothetical protein
MLAWELLQLLAQKREAGDPAPPYTADVSEIVDPRRAGSQSNVFVGPAAAGGHQAIFVVPRTGIYWLEVSIFARAGSVRVWDLSFQTAASVVLQLIRAVSTSQGWRWGPYKIVLEAGDLVVLTNFEATVLGDDSVANIWNYELAASI